MGSGTFGIAALKLKRKLIGIEIDPERLKVAEANIARVCSESNKQQVIKPGVKKDLYSKSQM